MRTQLICLADAVGITIAGTVSSTWASLSSACHLHPYELAPTAGELLSWTADVQGFCDDLTGPITVVDPAP
jgi:hypothetical protein